MANQCNSLFLSDNIHGEHHVKRYIREDEASSDDRHGSINYSRQVSERVLHFASHKANLSIISFSKRSIWSQLLKIKSTHGFPPSIAKKDSKSRCHILSNL